MEELVQGNKKVVLIDKKKCYKKNTQKMNLSLTLPPLLTLKEKGLKPYWNSRCQELQSMLWLPQTIDSQEVDLNLSDGLSNFTEVLSSHWKREIRPKHLIQKSLSVLLPASAIPTTENAQQNGKKMIIVSKKIRFYPENEEKYFQALTLYRRAYNLAVSHYINDTYKDKNGEFKNLRPDIKSQCKKEQKENKSIYNSIIVDNAVLSALTTFKAVMGRNKKKKGDKSGFSKIRFKNKKSEIHSFAIDRMPKGLNPAPRVLGNIFLTETVPKEAINKSATITYNKGRWFLQVQQHIKIKSEIQGTIKTVAIDPGVRTFATCYSDKKVIIAGENLAQEKLFPIMKKVDKIISQKVKLENLKIKEKPQWYKDRIVFLNKKINKLKSKKDDIISDLHNRLAFELVSNYDVIFLPTFETKKMVFKKGKRQIRRNTVRQMLDLNHYKFKIKLKWYAKKYGKHLVDVNESYTSKTKSWNGEIDSKLGSKKIIKGDNFFVDRDINAARGILLKHITRVA